MAIFPHSRHPLRIETKTEIYQQYRRGESVAALAQRFDQTRTRIYRIINDLDAARIMELPLDYIGNEQFARLCSEKKEREILRALPENDPPARKPRVPSGLPAYLASLYEVPLLTREQESHLFRKMNYLKYKASTLRAQLDLNRPTSRLMRQIEKLYDESVATKNQDRPCQSSAGGLDCQALRRSNAGLLRAGQRWKYVVAQGGGQVRFLAGQQVQHVRHLGDHEELRPHVP